MFFESCEFCATSSARSKTLWNSSFEWALRYLSTNYAAKSSGFRLRQLDLPVVAVKEDVLNLTSKNLNISKNET